MKAFSKKELAWINRLQKTLDAIPKSLQVYDNETCLAIYKGEIPENDTGGVDCFADCEKVTKPQGQWEFGAW